MPLPPVTARPAGGWRRTAFVLALFALLFVSLTVSSYTRKSATWDEPAHLTSGWAALRYGDYRLGLSHPPFLRLWAALPLLATPGVRLDRRGEFWREGRQWSIAHQFLYRDNDADRLLYRARFMTVLLGLLLGVLVFAWGREILGFGAATAVLGLYTLEPNILAHAGLVTTDFGLACFFFGAVYFLWRTSRSLTAVNAAGLCLFFALAQASKFPALLLWPLVPLLLAGRVLGKAPWPCPRCSSGELVSRRARGAAACGLIILLLLIMLLALWAAYGFAYGNPEASKPFLLEWGKEMGRLADPRLAGTVNWLDRHHLLPHLYLRGFLLNEGLGQRRSAYLLGRYSEEGWWYYFPVAFLAKTPLAVLILFGAGLWLMLRKCGAPASTRLFVLLPPALYLAAAMHSHVNIGLRHILPVYPFVLLASGWAAKALIAGRRRRTAAVLALLLLVEFAVIYPDYLAAFNLAAGGPWNGHRILIDSNLDWGQDLKGLKKWMDGRGVRRINLSYAGTADPGYYGIDCVYLMGAPYFAMGLMRGPELPGWVAVSVTNLYAVHYGQAIRDLYRPLRERRPEAVIGHSINLYRVEKPWWGEPPGG